MIIIGISGKKQSGKDTAFEFMQKQTKQHSTRIGFADSLKEEIAKEFKVSVEAINHNKDKFRILMQQWGTLKRELIHPDYWIHKVRDKIYIPNSIYINKYEVIFITDVRFKNEANWIKSVNGFLIRINRPISTDDFHESETHLDDYTSWDCVLFNAGTLDDLKKETLDALKYIKTQLSSHNHIV